MSCHASASSVTHSLPPPTHEGRKDHQGFGNCFSAILQFPTNSLCLLHIPESASPLARRAWAIGNRRDDGRAVSHICHSLVRSSSSVSQAYNEHTLVVDGSFPIHESRCGIVASRLPHNVYSAELDNFLGSLPPPPPSHSLPCGVRL